MVGFISEPTIEDLDQAPKLKTLNDPLDPIDSRADDFSFADSFLDFDSIKDWFEDFANQEMADVADIKTEVIDEERGGDTGVQGQIFNGSKAVILDGPASVDCGMASREMADGADAKTEVVEGQICNGSKSVFDGPAPIDCKPDSVAKVENEECEKSENLNCSIEDEMGKVSLVGGSASSVLVGENGVKSITANENSVKSEALSGEADSESESSEKDESESESSETDSSGTSSSASSSSSSSEDHDEETVKEEEGKQRTERKFVEEVEEGEIRDADDDEDNGRDDDIEAMVGWSDTDVNDGEGEEEDSGGDIGPIKSKNELTVKI